MNTFRKSAVTTAVVFGLAIAAQARADLIVSVNGTTEATQTGANTQVSIPASITVGSWSVSDLGLVGQQTFGGTPELFDARSFSVSSSGASAGKITLTFVETNLTGPTGAQDFSAALSNTLFNATETSSVYVDTNNGSTAGVGTLIGTASATAPGSFSTLAGVANIAGEYSVSEVVTITATGAGANLSADDSVSVPEPGVLSLMGLGLSAVAFLRRRKSI